MDREARTMEGIQLLEGREPWEAVDVLWCDSHAVDGHLAEDYYGEVLPSGWYYEPLVQVDCNVYSPREHYEGLRGPFVTSEHALRAAIDEAFYSGEDRQNISRNCE